VGASRVLWSRPSRVRKSAAPASPTVVGATLRSLGFMMLANAKRWATYKYAQLSIEEAGWVTRGRETDD
jgi:hypothetical protein